MLEDLYGPVPSFLMPYSDAVSMRRLKKVDMNCGVNYTSLKLFSHILPYSRYEHSLHTALLAWHFTGDKVQTLASLFHDIATPAFAHTVDFMHGDYLKQESTEEKTASIIQRDQRIVLQLERDGIPVEAVMDYHRYPLCDNNSPRLSCDRLEYTLGNSFNYGFVKAKELPEILRDIEPAEQELVFGHESCAFKLGMLSIACGQVYAGAEDRYAMKVLSELLRKAEEKRIIKERDLYTGDEESIISLLMNSCMKNEWIAYTGIAKVQVFAQKVPGSEQVFSKKRYIDPLVKNKGRLGQINSAYNKKRIAYLHESQDGWLKGVRNENNCCGQYE